MSMGGLEPPRISPHAPETCVSTISPHRLIEVKIILQQPSNIMQYYLNFYDKLNLCKKILLPFGGIPKKI